ncbi:hypothetical protein [Clostridium tagluense]|uniref:Uncharacterized protein n=1 Tax=Clostridium tagluense TaxID=360422 RepID=A0A401ULK7_9CLOT|nr:hypothetical protein [Clostridium tagluense]GCD10412.1 hypothetical protein Ctaglu_20350 [Clostridium tagluense]
MKNENTYIMNLEACYIYKDIMNGIEISSKNKDLNKLFSATIPYSLETIRMDEIYKDTFYEVNKKQYTKKIINITFEKNYTVWNEDKEFVNREGENQKGKRVVFANKKKIRKYLYVNGFVMDGIKYIFYKRGAGKAKNGYALYIQDSMQETLIDRSRLGLKFEKNELLDLTSVLAYESLITSGLSFTIELDPKTEILLIEDIYGIEFDSNASVTRESNGEIITGNEILKLQNCLTDGQALIDESIFDKYGKSGHAFMLLRNDLLKSCGFNTKIQAFFLANNITTVIDMFGTVYDASKIKLITTPNSIKFLKFAYKIGDGSKKGCYEYWKEHITNVFGVVKCDKEGNYGSYNRTTYQLLNSIPNLSYEDLMAITEREREYVMLLKNDNAVFRNYLGCDAKASLKLEKHMDNGDISLYEDTDLMNALLMVNSDMQYTKKFKKMKSDLIANYVSHLKQGKIRMKDNKYVTLISNPYEMLLASIGKYDGKSIMHGREVYCSYYEDGQEFCATRNPHINGGNVMYTRNKHHKEYIMWFNFTDNICVINFYDNDAPDRLQGADTDSDTMLLLKKKIMADKAKYCEDNFPTPINRVRGSSKPRKNNMEELYKLDVILSDNYIGRIVNMSQIINSYLNDAITKGKSQEIIDELYHASSRLSSMSQIEIDKSKKVFDNISMSKELSKMRQIQSIRYAREEDKYGEMVNKMIVPNFFDMISDSNEYRVFEKFDTPLDILQEVLLFNRGKRLEGDKNKEMKELLVKNSRYVEGISQKRQFKPILEIIAECGKKINGLRMKTCTLNDKSKKTVEKKAKKEAIEKIKDMEICSATILNYLKLCFSKEDKDYSKYATLSLNILFCAKKKELLPCFKKGDMDNDEVLIKMEDKCDYNIFGEEYQKSIRKNLT